MIIGGIAKNIFDHLNKVEVKGKVVLMKKNVLDLVDFNAKFLDDVQDFLGQSVSFQLVSSTVGDHNNGNRGVVGDKAYLERNIFKVFPTIVAGESEFNITFNHDKSHGIPGAVIVKNNHLEEFYLKSITIEDFPEKGRIHFVCNSWVYNVLKYDYDRIFFANDVYLPDQTPAPLKPYREEELRNLRGDHVDRPLHEWDRVYNYAYYNDLGSPDIGIVRPVLGGSEEYPYPRRGKTGRPHTLTDPKTESRLLLPGNLFFYVPRDEKFGHLKFSDFVGYALKAISDAVIPLLKAVLGWRPNEPDSWESFEQVHKLFRGGLPIPNIPIIEEFKKNIPFEMLKTIVTTQDGQSFLKFPKPQVIQEDKNAWRTDEEFAREMLAGVNPHIIRSLQEFPPTSTLDPSKYGNHVSSITAADVEKNLGGLTVQEAMDKNRLYILDYHDTLIPFLNKINSTVNKVYATRTILFLKDDGTLKPLVVELSLPNPDGEQYGAINQVFTPAELSGVEGAVWELAKAYVGVNDDGVHELISHWLKTHAVTEPFVLATNRHLSALHPINKLLVPHYRDTMNINSLARQTLISGGGILESIVFPDKYAMEISAKVYNDWNFLDQALPADLLKRGVAVEDSSCPHNLRLLIKDYPYAVDGLEIWSAIETWVKEYCSIYYPTDIVIQSDTELQAWWKEVREVGHGDLKDRPWWPKMQTIDDLTRSCTIIIWIASALHAAVNFGQFSYNAFVPGRPTVSRRFMPVKGTEEYEELKNDPEKVFFKIITTQLQSIVGISLMEVLSSHASDEVYLGTRDSIEWTNDKKAIEAFKRFGERLAEVANKIDKQNNDPSLKNRRGPVKVPYTLLFPTSPEGVTGAGIPNSISI